MSGQREATEAARERLRELRRLLPKTTYTSTDERTIAVGALAFLVDGFTRALDLAEKWAALAPEDDWGDNMADTVLADAGRSVRAALLGES